MSSSSLIVFLIRDSPDFDISENCDTLLHLNNFIKYEDSSSFLKLWDLKTNKSLWSIKNKLIINKVLLSPKRDFIACASYNTVIVRNYSDGALVWKFPVNKFFNFYFIQNGKKLVISSSNSAYKKMKLMICDTKTGNILSLFNHNPRNSSMSISPDNEYIATGMFSYELLIWKIS